MGRQIRSVVGAQRLPGLWIFLTTGHPSGLAGKATSSSRSHFFFRLHWALGCSSEALAQELRTQPFATSLSFPQNPSSFFPTFFVRARAPAFISVRVGACDSTSSCWLSLILPKTGCRSGMLLCHSNSNSSPRTKSRRNISLSTSSETARSCSMSKGPPTKPAWMSFAITTSRSNGSSMS